MKQCRFMCVNLVYLRLTFAFCRSPETSAGPRGSFRVYSCPFAVLFALAFISGSGSIAVTDPLA